MRGIMRRHRDADNTVMDIACKTAFGLFAQTNALIKSQPDSVTKMLSIWCTTPNVSSAPAQQTANMKEGTHSLAKLPMGGSQGLLKEILRIMKVRLWRS
ncbi:hypothetical protein CLAIMM_13421 [Cladophialophora immunda]|nr:hypothetical protein CLAIMM_13421 [Cladophialophora immunda]